MLKSLLRIGGMRRRAWAAARCRKVPGRPASMAMLVAGTLQAPLVNCPARDSACVAPEHPLLGWQHGLACMASSAVLQTSDLWSRRAKGCAHTLLDIQLIKANSTLWQGCQKMSHNDEDALGSGSCHQSMCHSAPASETPVLQSRKSARTAVAREVLSVAIKECVSSILMGVRTRL